jgi:hypothetical protein
LSDKAPPPAAEEPVPAEAGPAGELPPWLEAVAPTEVAPGEAEMPPWLEAALPAETAGEVEGPPPSEAEMLAWLETALPAEGAPGEAGIPPSLEAAPSLEETAAGVELPPVLEAEKAVEPAAEEPGEPAEGEPWAAPVSPEEIEALPEWVRALQPEKELAPTPPQAPAPAPAAQKPAPKPFFEGLELPEWLRTEEEAAAVPAEAPAGELDWLEKLAGEELPGEEMPVAAVMDKLPRPELPPLSPMRQHAAQLLAGLVASPEPVAQARPLHLPSMPQRMLRWFGSRWPMLLLAVVVGVLVLGNVSFPVTPPSISLDTSQAVSVIEKSVADPGAVALVAYDWDVQRAAEMQPLALAVTSHLIRREARIIAVSTVPQGGQLAQDVFQLALGDSRVLKTNQVYRYGEDYVNLGLRTGAESALRLLVAQPLWATFPRDFQEGELSANMPLIQEAGTLDDVALLVVIAGEEDRVTAWLEQVRSRYPDKPCLLIVPAELLPLVQPYLDARMIAPDAVLRGFPAAVEYVAWLDRNEGIKLYTDLPLERRQNIVVIAEIVLVGVILVGNLVELVAWLLGLRKAPPRG